MGVGAALGVMGGASLAQGVMGMEAAKGKDKVNNALADLQSARDYNSQLRQEFQATRDVANYNQAAVAKNSTNMARNQLGLALQSLQRANAYRDQAQQAHLIGRQKNQMLGATDANAAASGTIGNSVAAVRSDVEHTMAEALTRSQEDWETQVVNMDTQAYQMAWGIEDSFTFAKNVGDVGTAQKHTAIHQSTAPSLGMVFLGAAVSTASAYGMQKMNLGLQKPV